MSDLATQFADILKKGDATFASSLADALSKTATDGGSSTQTKAEANYQSKSDSDKMCSNCKHYQGDGSCEVVSGKINPHGISDLYEAGKDTTDTTLKDDTNAQSTD